MIDPPGKGVQEGSWPDKDNAIQRWDLPAALPVSLFDRPHQCMIAEDKTHLSPEISVKTPVLKPPPKALSKPSSPVPTHFSTPSVGPVLLSPFLVSSDICSLSTARRLVDGAIAFATILTIC